MPGQHSRADLCVSLLSRQGEILSLVRRLPLAPTFDLELEYYIYAVRTRVYRRLLKVPRRSARRP